jgi:hypothetical protein
MLKEFTAILTIREGEEEVNYTKERMINSDFGMGRV